MPGLARVLSKLGYCSRSKAAELARAGRVRVDGVVRRDPEYAVKMERLVITVDGVLVSAAALVYLMLHKPRGLVTTAADEKGRETVFTCLRDAPPTHLTPVGRLDQASEGLLLFTNDNAWSDALLSPASHLDKTYHVQIDRLPDKGLLHRLTEGLSDNGQFLRVKSATVLREGSKNAWLEIVLDEGRNRQIRRILEALGIEVLRLVRVAVGGLRLGDLARGCWRHLTTEEVKALASRASVHQLPGQPE